MSSNGGVTVAGGANLNLPVGGSLDMLAAGSGGIEIGADFNAASGSFSAATGTAGVGSTTIGGITLDSGRSIDVSALWVNRAIDGANAQAAAAGGNVTLSSATSLDLLASSRIDVSGGATVGTSGKVASTAAGSITLNSNLFRSDQTTPASPVHIGAALIGDSISGGGALTISADSLTIGAKPIPGGIADGAGVGSLQLSSAFFDLGSFSSYNLNARSAITVAPGTSIAPQAKNWLPSSVASAEPTGTDPASFLALGSLPESQRAPASLVLSAQTLVGTSVAYGDLSLGRGASITTDPLASVTLNAGASLAVNGSIDAPGGNVSVALVGANLLTPLPGGQTALSLGPQSIIDVSGTVVLQPQTGPLPIGTVLAGGNVLLGVSRNTRYAPVLIAPGAVIAADGSSASIGVATTSPDGTVTQSLQKVASAGGSITVVPSSGGGVLGGTLHALAGGPGVSGGSFRLAQPADGSAPIGAPASVVVQQEPVSGASAVPDVVTVSAQTLAQNFSDATLQAGNQIRFAGDVNLAMAGNLMLDAPALVASGQTRGVDVSAASSLQLGASYQAAVSPAGAIGGTAALTLGSGLVELFGHQVVQGFGSISIDSASELRLESVGPLSSSQGDFAVQGSLKLSAQQVVPTTATSFLVDAPGHSVLVTGGDSSAAVPLSAQSSLTINAADISLVDPNHPEAYGVLRSPFGSIGLNASDRITLGSGSLISVSGAGTTVPYGETTGGMGWTYNQSNPVNAPAQKAISLNAPTVDIGAGSTLDLSGGGTLVAQEFVPGIGGSRNIFAGAAGGAFAVVPASGAYAAQDTDILRQADSSQKTAALQLGRDISFGSGGPIPAGTYAVLPAQYATLPGAFLVTPAASSAPLVLGAAVPQTDGSVLMGGRYVEAGTPFASALPQSFRVLTSAQAATYSEIDQSNANQYFSRQAVASGTAVPPLPTDAGRLNIAAASLALNGGTLFTLPTTSDSNGVTTQTGRGGELDIAAPAIAVGGAAASGVLSLDPSALNATGAALVVLGGQRNATTGLVSASASQVSIDNAGTPLTLGDLVLVANNSVSLEPNAAIAAPAATTNLPIAPALSLIGDGALLRVSSDQNATSTRTGAHGAAGTLTIASGASISGGAITAEGTLVNSIAADATLTSQAMTLSAGHIAVGAVPDGLAGTLVLTPKLASQVAGAQALTLRAATGIDFYDSTTLGGSTVLGLQLDTPAITLIGSASVVTIEAGALGLLNDTGATPVAPAPGKNNLTLQATGAGASSGQILLGAGAVAVSGAGSLTLAAQHEVVLGSGANLVSAGDLRVDAAALEAAGKATASLGAAGAFTLLSNGGAASAGAGLGAQVSISARTVAQDGLLILPSGNLTLNASAPPASSLPTVEFGAGSQTDLSGRSTAIDGVTVSTPGGSLAVRAPAGNVAIDAAAQGATNLAAATLDVSAPGAAAGSIAISAPLGAVGLQGVLRATSPAGGGALTIDSGSALDLAAVAAMLNTAPGNFAASVDLRSRSGDLTLAAGVKISSQNISIAADNGNLNVAGALDASGASGTQIFLAAGHTLDIEPGAAISAHSNGSVGSRIQLKSGGNEFATATGNTSPIQVDFDGGSIDSSGAVGGTAGILLVSAQRNVTGTDLAVGGSGGTTVVGAARIEVEAVENYTASTVGNTLITAIGQDNQTLGNGAPALLARVGGLIGQGPAALELRSGVEIDSSGDLTMAGVPAVGGWNLTSFTAGGKAQAQPSGAPHGPDAARGRQPEYHRQHQRRFPGRGESADQRGSGQQDRPRRGGRDDGQRPVCRRCEPQLDRRRRPRRGQRDDNRGLGIAGRRQDRFVGQRDRAQHDRQHRYRGRARRGPAQFAGRGLHHRYARHELARLRRQPASLRCLSAQRHERPVAFSQRRGKLERGRGARHHRNCAVESLDGGPVANPVGMARHRHDRRPADVVEPLRPVLSGICQLRRRKPQRFRAARHCRRQLCGAGERLRRTKPGRRADVPGRQRHCPSRPRCRRWNAAGRRCARNGRSRPRHHPRCERLRADSPLWQHTDRCCGPG